MSSQTAPAQGGNHNAPKRRQDFKHEQQQHHSGKNRLGKPKKKTKRERNIGHGCSEDVLRLDIEALRLSRKESYQAADAPDEDIDIAALPAEGSEIQVQVHALSSGGDGLAMRDGDPSGRVYVVPFSVPGDTVKAQVFRHLPDHTVTNFLAVSEPSSMRDDSRIRCGYFAKCSGCQFQMLSYADQLAHKKTIVQKAYRNFSNLAPELVPPVQDTIASPLQYGYRTKLTPHYDHPPGVGWRNKQGKTFPECPSIGFNPKGRQTVLDIEDCPIGTDALRHGMKSERERMQAEYSRFSKGATILLRENTQRYPKDGASSVPEQLPPGAVKVETDENIDIKTCETDPKATTTEYVEELIFKNPAGAFFQNNNSILPTMCSYIREHAVPPGGDIKYLIDAYCGSGFFTISLGSRFQHSTGIDINSESIASANINATLNGLDKSRFNFIAADAPALFKNITYNPDETVVILDPPRRGCDEDFLQQLRRFGPKRVVYVSCNVHTQARDVGFLVRGEGDGKRYEMESLRGLDLFPQTAHVEGLAILNRVDEPAQEQLAAQAS
ncbi:uracil-5--methyltransferase [Stachybotrys elegans]|uniref:Uracil-5--methyltransferase n=1 Tax=Stachybotrys elegans TaxID=80388 RepID=A0A8K0SYF5_9HYPO|nr:uracil-5--methyltransferase [Stachybotrys elegans]